MAPQVSCRVRALTSDLVIWCFPVYWTGGSHPRMILRIRVFSPLVIDVDEANRHESAGGVLWKITIFLTSISSKSNSVWKRCLYSSWTVSTWAGQPASWITVVSFGELCSVCGILQSKWSTPLQPRILRSKRTFPAGQELTFDYTDSVDEEREEQIEAVTSASQGSTGATKTRIPCRCGAKSCRKWLWTWKDICNCIQEHCKPRISFSLMFCRLWCSTRLGPWHLC